MKNLFSVIVLSSALTLQASAFYFPEVATGDGSVDWNEMFSDQRAQMILTESQPKDNHAQWGLKIFKGYSPAFLKSETMTTHELLTLPQVESYATNIAVILDNQIGYSLKNMMQGKVSELPSLYNYKEGIKANARALTKGQILKTGLIINADIHKSFLSQIMESMEKKSSIPEGTEREYIDLMDQFGLN